MDRPDFVLSDAARIKFVRNLLAALMQLNKVELYEVRRAIALMMQESDEKRKHDNLERRQH